MKDKEWYVRNRAEVQDILYTHRFMSTTCTVCANFSSVIAGSRDQSSLVLCFFHRVQLERATEDLLRATRSAWTEAAVVEQRQRELDGENND